MFRSLRSGFTYFLADGVGTATAPGQQQVQDPVQALNAAKTKGKDFIATIDATIVGEAKDQQDKLKAIQQRFTEQMDKATSPAQVQQLKVDFGKEVDALATAGGKTTQIATKATEDRLDLGPQPAVDGAQAFNDPALKSAVDGLAASQTAGQGAYQTFGPMDTATANTQAQKINAQSGQNGVSASVQTDGDGKSYLVTYNRNQGEIESFKSEPGYTGFNPDYPEAVNKHPVASIGAGFVQAALAIAAGIEKRGADHKGDGITSLINGDKVLDKEPGKGIKEGPRVEIKWRPVPPMAAPPKVQGPSEDVHELPGTKPTPVDTKVHLHPDKAQSTAALPVDTTLGEGGLVPVAEGGDGTAMSDRNADIILRQMPVVTNEREQARAYMAELTGDKTKLTKKDIETEAKNPESHKALVDKAGQDAKYLKEKYGSVEKGLEAITAKAKADYEHYATHGPHYKMMPDGVTPMKDPQGHLLSIPTPPWESDKIGARQLSGPQKDALIQIWVQREEMGDRLVGKVKQEAGNDYNRQHDVKAGDPGSFQKLSPAAQDAAIKEWAAKPENHMKMQDFASTSSTASDDHNDQLVQERLGSIKQFTGSIANTLHLVVDRVRDVLTPEANKASQGDNVENTGARTVGTHMEIGIEQDIGVSLKGDGSFTVSVESGKVVDGKAEHQTQYAYDPATKQLSVNGTPATAEQKKDFEDALKILKHSNHINQSQFSYMMNPQASHELSSSVSVAHTSSSLVTGTPPTDQQVRSNVDAAVEKFPASFDRTKGIKVETFDDGTMMVRSNDGQGTAVRFNKEGQMIDGQGKPATAPLTGDQATSVKHQYDATISRDPRATITNQDLQARVQQVLADPKYGALVEQPLKVSVDQNGRVSMDRIAPPGGAIVVTPEGITDPNAPTQSTEVVTLDPTRLPKSKGNQVNFGDLRVREGDPPITPVPQTLMQLPGQTIGVQIGSGLRVSSWPPDNVLLKEPGKDAVEGYRIRLSDNRELIIPKNQATEINVYDESAVLSYDGKGNWTRQPPT